MIHLMTFLIAGPPAWSMNFSRLEELLYKNMDQRIAQFRRGGHEAREFLRLTARRKDAGLALRWRALTTMGRLDPVGFRPDIEWALRSSEWFARNAAAIAIRNVERDVAVNWSVRLLRDPALVVRTQAVRNLIDLDARETEPLLWKMLFAKVNFRGQDGLWIRAHLAEAVAKFSSRRRVEDFRRLLSESDERLHKWAIQGLERATGMRIGDIGEPLEVRRRKWLSRLDGKAI
jgi:HEAT repeat protein